MTTLNNENKENKENKEDIKPKTKVPTVEVEQKNTEEDDKMLKLCLKRYSKHIDKFDDDLLLRMVRGYAHEPQREKATFERIDHYIEMYEKYDFANICNEEWTEEETCLKGWPVFIYGEDNQGHPIMYDEMATMTPSDFEKSFGKDKEKLRKFRFRFMRRLAKRKKYLSKKYGKLIYKHIMVMNVSNAGLTAAYQYKNLAQEIISEEQHLFPETLYKLYIVNSGWVFSTIWKLYSSFADPITVKKIQVLKGQSDFLPKMLEEISIDEIPKKYGGKGKLDIKLGYDAQLYQQEILLQKQNKLKKEEKNKE